MKCSHVNKSLNTNIYIKRLFLLSDKIEFPHPSLAGDGSLLAVGGDLCVERLLLAYANGIFPWYSDDEPICWHSPAERCVLYPEKVKVSKSMKKIISDGVFEVRTNTAFSEVIRNCKKIFREGQDGTWITDEMEAAYINLHKLGIAQSIEVWQKEKLVGGLYGLKMGKVFCGESMFSLVSNGSKMALIWLCKNGGYRLIDCQVETPHLMSMGAELMLREEYLKLFKTLNT